MKPVWVSYLFRLVNHKEKEYFYSSIYHKYRNGLIPNSNLNHILYSDILWIHCLSVERNSI
jgi:hypothetical protein